MPGRRVAVLVSYAETSSLPPGTSNTLITHKAGGDQYVTSPSPTFCFHLVLFWVTLYIASHKAIQPDENRSRMSDAALLRCYKASTVYHQHFEKFSSGLLGRNDCMSFGLLTYWYPLSQPR